MAQPIVWRIGAGLTAAATEGRDLHGLLSPSRVEAHLFRAVRAHTPAQLELFVAARAQLAELRLAVRAQHVLGIDWFATARTWAQLPDRTARLGQRLRLQLQRAPLGHGQRRPNDHVDE